MKQWTIVEIEDARRELEQASASALGRMIFEFSRLDMSLGLMLAWAHEGSQLEALTKLVSGYTFHKKLELLEELAHTKYQADQKALDAHAEWLAEAHEVRANRNNLIHGRWGVDPVNNQVINVVGLPTREQVERRHSITELNEMLARMQQLQKQLSMLRELWPV